MPYGYTGALPNQIKNNSGVFSVADITDLTAKGQAGGSLELIAEETFTTSSVVGNTSIQENKYDVHLLHIVANGSTSMNSGIQFYESGVLETANVYQYASKYGTSTNSFGDTQNNGANRIYTVNFGATYKTGIYIYLYNLGNSSKYSSINFEGNQDLNGYHTMFFGGGVLPQASTVDGFKIYLSTGTITGEYKLYGVKQ
jgi:hypothetical protein